MKTIITAVLIMISMMIFGQIWGGVWIKTLSLHYTKWIMGK